MMPKTCVQTTTPPVIPPCTTSRDCQNGQICILTECLTSPSGACHAEIPCQFREQCIIPVGQTFGSCIAENGCEDHNSCGANEQCVIPQGRSLGDCVILSPGRCKSDSNCVNGQFCNNSPANQIGIC